MSLPVCLRKKPHHIFKCTSVEQYSSLLGIHKESILVRLSTSSWIMHLGLALSALFRGSNDLSSSEQLCPGRLPHEWYFSEGLRITRAAHVLSCHHAALVFICHTLLMRQTFWQHAVTVADACCYDMKTVKVLKSHLSSFFFCAWGGGDGQNIVSVTLITPESQHIYFYFIYWLHVGWFTMDSRYIYVVLLSADAEAARQMVMTDHSIH